MKILLRVTPRGCDVVQFRWADEQVGCKNSWFRVSGLGFRAKGIGFGDGALECGVNGFELRAGLRCGVDEFKSRHSGCVCRARSIETRVTLNPHRQNFAQNEVDPTSEVAKAKTMFNEMDLDYSRGLSKEELKIALKHKGIDMNEDEANPKP